MTGSQADPAIGLVLLDIEGTTTPIAFVHEVLFPFARAHMARWSEAHALSAAYAQIRRDLHVEHHDSRARGEAVPDWRADSPRDDRDSLLAFAGWLMDRDRKSSGLKHLQGLIWEDGYRSGVLRGEVYADVPVAMQQWHEAGLGIAIYSSGSVLAQRLLFESTEGGDLTPLIMAFFDTAVGSKEDPRSYARIAARLVLPPSRILFVSDVTAELEPSALR